MLGMTTLTMDPSDAGGGVGAPGTFDAGGAAIAQYLVTKITFWGAYELLLVVSSSHVSLYHLDDFKCTQTWPLNDISDIEVVADPDQFLLVFDKSRFRTSKVRFKCLARSHLLALLHKLRRHYSIEPIRVSDYDAESRRQHYQCTEHFADDSYDYFLLEVGLSGVTLLDEHGRKVSQFPFVNIQRVATSTAHPDGLVISTMFQERLFLCHPRTECITHMQAAAQALGVTLTVGDSPLNMQLLRLRNSQALDNPAVVCFEVEKSVDDGKIRQHIQLIFQGVAMVEVHRKLRTIVSRPYSTLLTVVRSDWDPDTVVLQFVHGDNLVMRVDARDQFIAMLLLVCREAGSNHVELATSTIKRNRVYHPHMMENVRETAGTSMEAFFLRRILQIFPSSEDGKQRSRSPLRHIGLSRQEPAWKNNRRKDKGVNARRHKQRRRGLRANPVLMEARLGHENGITLNDHISLVVAMEELNTNVPMGGISDQCNRQLLNKTIEALIEHVSGLVGSLRGYVDATTPDIITTLQALARLAQSPYAYFPEHLVPRLFDALHELVSRQHFLTCYWVLKLLQSYFEPRKSAEARRHRSLALQNFVENRLLLYSILDVIPATSSLSSASSGRWMRRGNDNHDSLDSDSEAHMQPALDQTLLFTKEERLEKDMNILTYEALFTLHHVLIYLQAKERHESKSATSSLAKAKIIEQNSAPQENRQPNWASTIKLDNSDRTPKWTSTIKLDDSDHFEVHQENYNLTASAKREIGEKLLSKYKFLMDSVVDVRLARSCHTIVTLISFLVNYFGGENKSKPRDFTTLLKQAHQRPVVEPQPRQRVVDAFEMGGEEEYRRKRQSTPLRISLLYDDDSTAEPANDKKNGRTLDELFAFLECYRDDVATLDDRSRLFPEQNTILIPLMGFSQASDTDSSGASIFNVSGMVEPARLRYEQNESEFLTLDQLEFNDYDDDYYEEDSFDFRPQDKVAIISEADLRREMDESDGFRLSYEERQQAPRTTQRERTSVTSDLSSIVDSGSSYVPRFMQDSNFRRLDTGFRGAAANPSRHFQSKPQPAFQHRAIIETQSDRGTEAPLKLIRDGRDRPVSATLDRRISAHTCDACIACNDVCDSENCFFCAEKEYQLQLAFAASSSLPRPRHSIVTTFSASSSFERKFSSCEVARHLTGHSCWVVVFGIVYDVTDLLSSHPGGMNVLINAAKTGKDCGELFVRKHAPSARRVLENYRLGEFYHCEKRTLPY